jgi:Lon protease-like protein
MPAPKTQPTYDDVNLLLKLYEMRREERMRKARAWFATNFRAATLEEFWKLCPAGSEENASYRQVTSYWEMVASFVNRGVLNEELFFENSREMLLVWVRIEPLLPLAREAFKDPFAQQNLEAVSRRYIAWMNGRAAGSYEAFAGRVK